ncbi:MAG: GNAT family N-acetyltransferase, partial [Bacteroidetes bacterium]|nr:GNAT family N-acetyltransferase [Bacteroidota bacterium]
MNINTSQEYVLENDRVLLRPLMPSDFEHLLPYAIQEPELWTYSLVSGAGEHGLKNYFEFAFQKKEMNDSYPFIVYDKRSQKYAGSTRF